MALRELRVRSFRCLEDVRLEAHPRLNVVSGANGAGKTSLLEAIFFLSRGRSFRAPRSSVLVRSGDEEAVLFARAAVGDEDHRLGARIGRAGTTAHFDGRPAAATAVLAEALPVQLIDPRVHELIQGGPEERRRYLDWGVFHVEPSFLAAWRRYRRALQQRNAALRQGLSPAAVVVWDAELAATGDVIDRCRARYLAAAGAALTAAAGELLDAPVTVEYRRGWDEERSLASVLAEDAARERAGAATPLGPHRAELRVLVDGQPARHRISRGQQKLLASALILGATRYVSAHADRAVILLVDEPAAELDGAHQHRLLEALDRTPGQIFVTALDPDSLPVSGDRRMFHVERGAARTLL